MKKLIAITLGALFLSTFAYADVFGPRPVQKESVSQSASASTIDPGTILAEVGAAATYLGVREGSFYDFHSKSFTNYAAATLYTFQPIGVAIDFGMINTDGVALTADYNLGQLIPAQGVPIASMLQYLYVGGGIDERNLDKSNGGTSWQTGYGLDIQFKGSF